jgi:tetrahydromethanopterin S-methyltransferase subunit A
MMPTIAAAIADALAIARDQLLKATAARKCHACGCFQRAVEALERAAPPESNLADVFSNARAVLVSKKYDCLGCSLCFPAVAENAFTEAYPGAARPSSCGTDLPVERTGWPPLPGDYQVVRYHAPVAVCVLNSEALVTDVASRLGGGIALVGTLRTENLGIERVVRNVLANPNIRFLVLCGEDTRQAIGHLPGHSLMSLFDNGLDEDGRIRGAKGKRPYLRNLTREQVNGFVSQVELVQLVGELDADCIMEAVEQCAARDPGPVARSARDAPVVPFKSTEPRKLVLDPAGFLVLFSDQQRGLVLEHYTNDGVLHCIVEGETAVAVGATAVERGLVSRLDHAVYLGRELARAEESLRTGTPYIQDRAAGVVDREKNEPCGCTGST